MKSPPRAGVSERFTPLGVAESGGCSVTRASANQVTEMSLLSRLRACHGMVSPNSPAREDTERP
jgi:hypothetical protein